jgi:archaellin
MNKKAEMGIGTLIIFIALLLVAAVAAGVLIQTTGSLQEKALTTGTQARSTISTNAEVIEVSATDGTDGNLNIFASIMKLSPGSDEIKLSEAILTFNTYDQTATLSYAGTGASSTNSADGYYTLSSRTYDYDAHQEATVLAQDFDEDGNTDFLQGGLEGANVYMNVSNGSSKYQIDLGACDTGAYDDGFTPDDLIASVDMTCTSDDNVTSITISPVNAGKGLFAVQYLQVGPNYRAGNLQRGDVIKVFYEAPEDVLEGSEVRLNFIPKVGTPTLTQFVTPEVISTERVYLYP